MTPIPPRFVVLLAEDDENDVLFIRRALEKIGLLGQLITVEDGEQVIAYFRGGDGYADRRKYPIPELLLLDHHMPKVSGLDVLFWIRTQKSFERLPALLLTTGLQPEHLNILRSLGAEFCLKSGSPQELAEGLEAGVWKVLPSILETRAPEPAEYPRPLRATLRHSQ